eukprot:s2150_g4.t1
MAEVWKIYCEHLEGETPSMIVAGDEFSLSETEATSRWLKGNPPSEVALARSGARDEMRFRPHREWIQTCRWLLQEARRYHSEFVWEAVETHVSPFDILIGLSHLSSFEAALEDLARQHRLRLGSDDEASSSEDSAEL